MRWAPRASGSCQVVAGLAGGGEPAVRVEWASGTDAVVGPEAKTLAPHARWLALRDGGHEALLAALAAHPRVGVVALVLEGVHENADAAGRVWRSDAEEGSGCSWTTKLR